MLLGTPVIAITLVAGGLRTRSSTSEFSIPKRGGDPLLFQHLFWFYSHPAVYIMILPAMGVISEIVACFSRKRVFGYNFVAMSSIAIAVFGFLVWAHHMFVAGISLYSALVFSFLSYLVAVPSAVKVFNWTATMYKGSIYLFDADALCLRIYRSVHHRRTDRACSWRRSASMSMSPTRTSSSPTSTTSWWVARSWDTSVECISGGRRFPGECIRKPGEAGGADRFRRFQSDLLPAIHSRLPRNAAPLLAVSAGISGAERALDRRSHASWRSDICCRWFICCGRCDTERSLATIHGARPAWNGRLLLRPDI